jgi:predicted site-specific integrase-resolvase
MEQLKEAMDAYNVTVSPAARTLEISSQSVINLHKQGKLPGITTTTGVRLFRMTDILKLKAEREARKQA